MPNRTLTARFSKCENRKRRSPAPRGPFAGEHCGKSVPFLRVSVTKRKSFPGHANPTCRRTPCLRAAKHLQMASQMLLYSVDEVARNGARWKILRPEVFPLCPFAFRLSPSQTLRRFLAAFPRFKLRLKGARSVTLPSDNPQFVVKFF